MLAAATQVPGMSTGWLLVAPRLPNTRLGYKEYHHTQRNTGTMIDVLVHVSSLENIFCYEDKPASANSSKFYAHENSKRGMEERKKKEWEKGRMKGLKQNRNMNFWLVIWIMHMWSICYYSYL
jgi:hypothetical protein